MTNSIRKNIIAPADWWDAFRKQADKEGVDSLAEWLCNAGKDKLPKRVQANLSERPKPHRPKKAD